MNRPYYTPPAPLVNTHKAQQRLMESKPITTPTKPRPLWDDTRSNLKAMALTKKEQERRRQSMMSFNKVDLLDPEIRRIDEEFGLSTPKGPVAQSPFRAHGEREDAENQNHAANRSSDVLFATPMKRVPSTPLPRTPPRYNTQEKQASPMQTPKPLVLTQRTPIKAADGPSPMRQTRTPEQGSQPQQAQQAEIDLEQEIKSMHLTWHRSKPPSRAKGTFSRRSLDATAATSASRWEVGQVADLASRLADSLYLGKEEDEEGASSQRAEREAEKDMLIDTIRASHSTAEAIVHTLLLFEETMQEKSASLSSVSSLTSTMLAEMAVLQSTVSKLAQRMDALEDKVEKREHTLEEYIDRKVSSYFEEKRTFNADIIGEVDEHAWQDWTADAEACA